MKKLFIAVALAVITAIAANAATVTWGAQKGYLYEAGSSEIKVTSGDAYLMFVTSSYTQSDLINAFNTAKGDVAATLANMNASGAMATGAGAVAANARIASTESTYSMNSDMSAYFVVFNGGNMYISTEDAALYDSVSDGSSVTFASRSTTSKLAARDASAGYAGAGWYAVPEPTSGLLMLVGLAGLALRRRRA